MESLRKNKSLFIDKEALYALLLCKEGLLYPVLDLMDEDEMNKVDKTGLYKSQSFPFSFILAPSGKQNKIILESLRENEEINLVCEGKICGELTTKSVFKINKQERLFKIMGGDIYSKKAKEIMQRLGEYAICGEYKLFLQEGLDFKDRPKQDIIQKRKELLQAKNVTSITIDASPITRVHEKIFHSILEDLDLLVIFLARKREEKLLDYKIRLECLNYIVENFLPKERILIFPFEDIYLFENSNGVILDAIFAQNLGCDRIVIGENHPHLALYYDHQKLHSIFDMFKEVKINIKMCNEFAYCKECGGIISTKVCPHGKHKHISYNSGFIQSILESALIPPSILVRKEISAKILSYLYPNRFKNTLRKYESILPNNGIVEEYSEEEIYLKLIELQQEISLN